jgi:hypothetical protein
MSSPKNLRPLAEISAEIYRTERQSVLTLGKLLLEAKEQLKHGEWLSYLKSIGWGDRNAQLHMAVARLAANTKLVADLDAAPTALYQLTWIAGEYADALPLAIARLKKSVERGDTAAQQRQVVTLSPQAKEAEDAGFKNITELALQAASDAFNQNCFGDEARYKSMMDQSRAIIKANPKTDDELKAVIAENPIPVPAGIEDESDEDEDEADETDEVETLPPPAYAWRKHGKAKVTPPKVEQKVFDSPQEAHASADLVLAWDKATQAQRRDFIRARKLEILRVQHEVGEAPGKSAVKAIADRAEARSKAKRVLS